MLSIGAAVEDLDDEANESREIEVHVDVGLEDGQASGRSRR
jgi:hypothetical protein